VLAHPSFPQIDKGLIPVVVKEFEYLIEILVLSRLDIRSQLFQSEFRLGFTVGMIEDIHQLSDDVAEALYLNVARKFEQGSEKLHKQLLVRCDWS
jgi:hypothetical protein